MKKKLFKEYAKLKSEAKEIEEKIKALAPQVLEDMGENDEIDSEWGVFIKASRRDWAYPEEIEKLADKLKEDKKVAEQTGTATYEEKNYLLFKTK